MLDRYIAGGEIDNAARNEERRHPPRAALVQRDRRVGDALDAANAGANHDAGGVLLVGRGRLPAGVFERLLRRAHRIDDELVDLALFLRLHPLVGIVGAVGAVADRDHAGDLAGDVGDVERIDRLRPALARDQASPGVLNPATERSDHAHAGDDDTPQAILLSPQLQHTVPNGTGLSIVSLKMKE